MRHHGSTGACLLFLLCLAAVCLTLQGCKDGPKTSDQSLERIDTKQLDKLLKDTKSRTVLLDPRPAQAFTEQHLPGAINIPLPDLRENDPRLAQAKTIVVYGKDWNDRLAPAAAKRLMAIGYKNVLEYRGGLKVWMDEGRKVQ